MSCPHPVRTCLLICTVLALMSCPAAARTDDVADAPVIHNGSEPRDGVRTLELEELWRRGGEDDEEVLFGVLLQVGTDPAGNIYLLDMQLSQVTVFTPDGEFLGNLSREGDGPGETRRPGDMFLTDDGRLGLATAFPGRVVYIDLAGQPAGTLELGTGDPAQGGFAILRSSRYGGNHTVLGTTLVSTDQEAGMQVRKPRIAAHADDGAVTATFFADSYELVFSEQTFHEASQLDIALRRFSVDGQGRVYIAPDREAYRVEVYEPDGRLLHVIERDYPEHRRTPDELEEWRRLFAASMRNVPFEMQIDLCPTAAPIDWIFGGLWAREDGRLWVRTSRSAVDQPPGVMLTYDVFAPDGHFAEQVRVACPGDGQEDALFFAGPDRVILVTGFMDAVRAMFGGVEGHEDVEPRPMEVVCYGVR